ncbi:hypothetical protein R8871_05761 [Paraburkholderia graminis C4D1M]|jgi:hypothetical protein|uniref:Uncharacterized protein n=1 Tax=Paraburkholderia graminis (strain ATCC 700544 / DSM 17151 / LMG 18924 / NCIMB 13744 / C4D1M) TaxID=396598 RepID=B1FTM3_PARG4|nr:hypothetical protein [Paraburkholderia graminis]EDT12915.1 conserved hypothetical protein [Paraburkholderia graminis C4D1M]CAB3731314.1 hypothetical protein R8871_05761 [Paraburkholderia graminis C4D1M]
MQSQKYRGYDVWGHAIVQENDGVHRPARYAASGTITRGGNGGKLIQASGVLGDFESEEDAQLAGLEWARAWVDAHD